MKITEENFIEEIKKRNEDGLIYVIDNYGWIIKTVINKHLFYLEDYKEECINDCLMGIWNNIYYFDMEKSSFKNWIAGIAKYKSIDYIRKYLKENENKNIDQINIETEDLTISKILEKEFEIEIKETLNILNEEDRKIFQDIYFKNEDVDTVAKKTGKKTSNIYNRLSRGRKKLKDYINLGGN